MSIKDTYPVQTIVISKDETKFNNTDEIISYLEDKVASHPVATYISTFDHYTHTKGLEDHSMNPDIVDVKLIVFCFGKELPIAQIAAVRPRSIAVVEEDDKFTISFVDAPNPQAHEAMIEWVKGVQK